MIGVKLLAVCYIVGAPALAGEAGDAFAALEREYEASAQAYFQKIDALLQEQPDLDLSDPTKLPKDPRADILRKMDAVVKAHQDAPEAKQISVATLYWSLQTGDEGSPDRFLYFASKYPDARRIADILLDLEYGYVGNGSPESWAAALKVIGQAHDDAGVQSASTFLAAKMALDQGRWKQAATGFEKVVASAGEGELKDRAKGFLYESQHLQIGMPMPQFEATQLDGKKIGIASLKGKVVLLDFWATWCPGCVAEIPTLRKISRKYGDRFVVLSLSADDSRETIAKFLKKNPMPGIATWDMKGDRFPIMEQFNIQGLPTWYLVDANGRISAKDPFGPKLDQAIVAALRGSSGS
jgi:thiol-disulfide isomerase/thioredoxin